MRKLAIFTSALLLVCSMSGCSQSSSSEEHVYTKVPDNSEMSASDDISSETTILDVFEDLEYTVATYNTYPEELYIQLGSTIPLKATEYELEVTHAGTESILLHISLDRDAVEAYQQEHNCIFKELEKEIEIPITANGVPTYLTSESLFSEDNRTAILKDMQNSLVSEITSQNQMKPNIDSDNPEMQMEVEPDSSTEIALDELYIVIPESNVDFMQLLSLDSSSPGIIWLHFNTAIYTPEFSVYGIYKGADDAYYVASNKPVFVDRNYTEGRSGQLKYEVDILNSKLAFPDKETALQCIQKKVAEQDIAVLKEIEIEE